MIIVDIALAWKTFFKTIIQRPIPIAANDMFKNDRAGINHLRNESDILFVTIKTASEDMVDVTAAPINPYFGIRMRFNPILH